MSKKNIINVSNLRGDVMGNTYDNLKNAYPDVEILPTDFQKYIFTIDNKISYEKIMEESLFITLKKN